MRHVRSWCLTHDSPWLPKAGTSHCVKVLTGMLEGRMPTADCRHAYAYFEVQDFGTSGFARTT